MPCVHQFETTTRHTVVEALRLASRHQGSKVQLHLSRSSRQLLITSMLSTLDWQPRGQRQRWLRCPRRHHLLDDGYHRVSCVQYHQLSHHSIASRICPEPRLHRHRSAFVSAMMDTGFSPVVPTRRARRGSPMARSALTMRSHCHPPTPGPAWRTGATSTRVSRRRWRHQDILPSDERLPLTMIPWVTGEEPVKRPWLVQPTGDLPGRSVTASLTTRSLCIP